MVDDIVNRTTFSRVLQDATDTELPGNGELDNPTIPSSESSSISDTLDTSSNDGDVESFPLDPSTIKPQSSPPKHTPTPTVAATTSSSGTVTTSLIFAVMGLIGIMIFVCYVRRKRARASPRLSGDLGIPTISVELQPNGDLSTKAIQTVDNTKVEASPLTTYSTSHDGAYHLLEETPKHQLAPTTPIIPLPRNSAHNEPESSVIPPNSSPNVRESISRLRDRLSEDGQQPITVSDLEVPDNETTKADDKNISVENAPVVDKANESSSSPITKKNKTVSIARMRAPPPPPPVIVESDVISVPEVKTPTLTILPSASLDYGDLSQSVRSSARGSLIEFVNVHSTSNDSKQIGI